MIYLSTWQALSLLGEIRDGVPMEESRARRALRDVGMTRQEIDEPYPEEGIFELLELSVDPDRLDRAAKEASEWMISRN